MEPLIILTEEQLIRIVQMALCRVMAESTVEMSQAVEKPLSITEAARYLNISVSTLYRYTSQRIIPHHKPGKVLYFLRAELDDWLQAHRKLTSREILEGEDDTVLANLTKRTGSNKNKW